jgi:putative tryptophan/tyrosine transport system substrate-binding protein
MRRREFITILGGAAVAWSRAVSAQRPAVPMIGFVSSSNSSPGGVAAPLTTAFRQGLSEGGYVDGRNVVIEFRGAQGQYERLPELLSDLIRRQASLIVASGGLVASLNARAATKTIPILFVAGFDPVEAGLVASLGHPGGNATGVSVNTTEMAQKRLELLHDLVPDATTIALLVNPQTNTSARHAEIASVEETTRKFGLNLIVVEASRESDLEPAFVAAVRQQAAALSVNADPFFTPRRAQIVALAARYGLPTVYPWREYVEAGGLMSYGPTFAWAYRQLGVYASRILNGAKPGDLPVQMPTTFDWVINETTVKALGLTVPRIMQIGAEFIQ